MNIKINRGVKSIVKECLKPFNIPEPLYEKFNIVIIENPDFGYIIKSIFPIYILNEGWYYESRSSQNVYIIRRDFSYKGEVKDLIFFVYEDFNIEGIYKSE